MKTRFKDEVLWHLPLLAAVFFQLWPLIFMASTSLKDLDQIFISTLNPLPLPPTLDNYRAIIGNFPILTYVFNTFVIAFFVTLLKIGTSILAAFAFVYYDFKGKEQIFNGMLLTFFIPITVVLMPNYLFLSKLDLLNTSIGVILPQMADGMGIFLMRQTIRSIPKALLEAAILEGAGAITVLRRVVLPLIRPTAIAMTIFFFINSWNEYFWPLLVLQDKENYTLPLALQMFISAEGGSEWGIAMAVAMLTSLPPLLLYLLCQKYILSTFMQSGVKG
ncbi:MAG TPA: carbohydrate ABC transporter permease [Candidatus Avacidaminococcus intestinavium]|uniref:Carbohydrate ABC transporter permease n=1 Tax=Candidatus Avacidaminococcus intestinavium TaxID=2840684 RepID=A0A9D1SKT4_9FIRM|nr:carbohydrate ABC transporter permease [Candidatus Avacidaminococcus intestinavium]